MAAENLDVERGVGSVKEFEFYPGTCSAGAEISCEIYRSAPAN